MTWPFWGAGGGGTDELSVGLVVGVVFGSSMTNFPLPSGQTLTERELI